MWWRVACVLLLLLLAVGLVYLGINTTSSPRAEGPTPERFKEAARSTLRQVVAPADDQVGSDGQPLRVVVLDPAGTPIPQARIVEDGHEIGRTDGLGRFSVELENSVLSAVGAVVISADGFVSREVGYAIPGDLVVRLLPEAAIEGVVVTRADGVPVENVDVRSRSVSVRTSAEGRFRLDGLGPGYHTLTVSARRLQGASGRLYLAPGEVRAGVVIEADVGVVVSGLVTIDKAVLNSGSVVLRNLSSGTRQVSRLTDDGRFEFVGVGVGGHELGVFQETPLEQYAPFLAATRTFEVENVDVEKIVDLGARCSVTVEVLFLDGTPARGVPIRYVAASANELVSTMSETGHDGRLRIVGLPKGTRLTVQPLVSGVDKREFTVTNREGAVRFRLDDVARLYGHLTESDGSPARPRLLLLTPREIAGAMPRSATSDATGEFFVDAVSPGSYVLRVFPGTNVDALQVMMKGSGSEIELTVDIPRGRNIVETGFVLPGRDGVIRGRVLSGNGAGVVGATVVCSGHLGGTKGPVHDVRHSAASGAFTCEGLLESMEYVVTAFTSDGEAMGSVTAFPSPKAVVELHVFARENLEDGNRGRIELPPEN